ncbi:hypothetical protein SPRG_02387 [Saprolegnia parasitica CBS 223.65]|uniref:Peroxisome assembly protein 12 n=1 Tax=Saprolegnia parasitica (strain CBS 223.65) TaxID=695850 RepID=A0A067D108_SAPPC|nr:hypothetical protein SPRG_02387 [Saprolegnia parasitica CBS 223.65]KDO32687.1 hypothetical protein SPRG_02387 [Saprolegnia parasitica CBS 223.65]|eukprot:XP_012196353.1 hypothetical protein SPRG_02387 [Saprolegnia parasitica CBS 223.65]
MTLFLANESVAGDEALPSTFELIMQDRMAGGFKPAAQYLVNVLCDTYPHLASSAPVKHFHETYALLKLLVERYCLAHYDSLLSERFYGIKRVELDGPLTERGRHFGLLYDVGVPYVKAKLDAYYHSLVATNLGHRGDGESDTDEDDAPVPAELLSPPSKMERFWRQWTTLRMWSQLKRLFVDVYPTAHFTYEGSFLLYQWMYLFGYTRHFTPFLRAMKVAFARITPHDISTFDQKRLLQRAHILQELGARPSLVNGLRKMLYKATWMTLDHSQAIVIFTIIGFKFIEWMYSDMNPRQTPHGPINCPPPPPPLAPQLNLSAIAMSSDTHRCGLCQRRRTNPASCISGFVFCYPCIYEYVIDHGECPVTRLPCDVSSVVRIYEDAEPSA